MHNLGIPLPNPLDSGRKKRRGGSFKGGEGHPQSVLTDKKVMALRRAFLKGKATRAELSREYGISQPYVSRLLIGSAWGHLPVLYEPKVRPAPEDGIRWRKHPTHKDYAVSENGDVQDLYTREFLLSTRYKKGFFGVKIKGQKEMLHRLMLEAFEGYPPDDGQLWRAHFRDLDRTNLHIDNLEWMAHGDVCRAYKTQEAIRAS